MTRRHAEAQPMAKTDPAGGGSPRPRVAVFARRPIPGVAKTRLAAGIGDAAAAGVYARVLYRLLLALAPRGADWDLELATAEASDADYFRTAFPEYRVVPQVKGDLGQRMAAQLGRGLDGGAPTAIVVGSDVPALGPGVIARAIGALARAHLVLGPAVDGGFYLIGVASSVAPILVAGAEASADLAPRLHRALFTGVQWSSGRELALTLDAAQDHGLAAELLPTLADLDRPSDLPGWRRRMTSPPAES